jgi:cytochrome c-type biogenesis protein CcmH/NrfG
VISIHLSDQEITAAAVGEREMRAAQHLQICGDCQQQVEMYRERMASLRQDICYSAGRSAIDWGRQSRAIQQGILAAQIRETQGRSAGFVLAMAVLTIVLVAFLFLGFHSTPSTTAVNQPPQISDSALLGDVEAQLDGELPEALQPANLLVGEMEGSYKKVSSHNNLHNRTRNTQ